MKNKNKKSSWKVAVPGGLINRFNHHFVLIASIVILCGLQSAFAADEWTDGPFNIAPGNSDSIIDMWADVNTNFKFIVEGGGTGAIPDRVGTVTSTHILDSTIQQADMSTDSIGTGQIKDNAITGAKIVDGTITASDLAADSVGNSELADNSVQSANIVDGNVTSQKLAVTTWQAINDNTLSQIEGDARYVESAGDTMTGPLEMESKIYMNNNELYLDNSLGSKTYIQNFSGNTGFKFVDLTPVTGGSIYYFTNALWFSNNTAIRNVASPDTDFSAANRIYVDDATNAGTVQAKAMTNGCASLYVHKSGDTMTGDLKIGSAASWHKIYVGNTTYISELIGTGYGFLFYDTMGGGMKYYTNALWFSNNTAIRNVASPDTDFSAANRIYVDDATNGCASLYVNKSGDTMTGNLSMQGNIITNCSVIATDAAYFYIRTSGGLIQIGE